MDSEFLGINKMGFVNQPFSSTTPVEVTGPRDVFRDIWTFVLIIHKLVNLVGDVFGHLCLNYT